MSTKPDIVLGDYNFNFQNDFPISSLMQHFNFKQLVEEQTHITSGPIDQV